MYICITVSPHSFQKIVNFYRSAFLNFSPNTYWKIVEKLKGGL